MKEQGEWCVRLWKKVWWLRNCSFCRDLLCSLSKQLQYYNPVDGPAVLYSYLSKQTNLGVVQVTGLSLLTMLEGWVGFLSTLCKEHFLPWQVSPPGCISTERLLCTVYSASALCLPLTLHALYVHHTWVAHDLRVAYMSGHLPQGWEVEVIFPHIPCQQVSIGD